MEQFLEHHHIIHTRASLNAVSKLNYSRQRSVPRSIFFCKRLSTHFTTV